MKTEIPYDKIAKQLKKDASEAEKESVRLWIESSDENRKLYKQILKSWRLQEALAFQPKKDEAWFKLKNNLNWTETSKGRRVFFRRALQISAILIILLGIGLLLKPTEFLFGEKMLAIKTLEEQKMVLLADGTEIFLNRNSELSYPEVFDGDNRQVILKGEAFFKVARNPDKPFIIATEETQTQVLGTSFNLRAYANESLETLTVTTGKVAFSSLNTDKKVILKPNQVGSYSLKSRIMSKQELADPNYMAWMNKIFVFNNQTLQSIVLSLSNAYGKPIEIRNKSLAKEHLTTSFNAMELDDVLLILSQTLDFEYSLVDSEKIIIK